MVNASNTSCGCICSKENLGIGTKMLIISNEELNDFIKIVKSLEDFSLLTKGVNEAVENDAKNQKGCLGMLAATSAFSL